jgi:hypothetical protein
VAAFEGQGPLSAGFFYAMDVMQGTCRAAISQPEKTRATKKFNLGVNSSSRIAFALSSSFRFEAVVSIKAYPIQLQSLPYKAGEATEGLYFGNEEAR